MALREVLVELGFEVDRKQEQGVNQTLGRLKKAAVGLAAAFATGALARGVRDMVELASSANETENVLNEAFGRMRAGVDAWADEQARVMGRSAFELKEFAAATGAIVGPMLGSEEAAAGMSTQIGQLAVDLGSFFNATDSDALQALQSGLIGSTEPLLRFGVNLKVAQLEAFALEQGITKSYKEMTEGEKVALRFRAIMAQTAKAQGDAARTADGYANQSKAFIAALKDAATVAGKELIPAAEKLLSALIPLARELSTSAGPAVRFVTRLIRGLVTGLDTLASLLVRMGPVWGTLTALVTAFGIAATVAGLKATLAFAGFLLTAAAIATISVAVLALIEDFQAMGEGGESVTGTLIQGFLDLWDETGSVFGAISEIINNAVEFWAGRDGVFAAGISFVVNLVGGLVQGFIDAGTAIGQAMSNAFDFIKKSYDTLIAPIVGGIGRLASGVASVASKIGSAGASLFGGGGEAQRARASVAPPGARNFSNTQTNEVSVQVDARGAQNPNQVGAAVGEGVLGAMRSSNRQLVNAAGVSG